MSFIGHELVQWLLERVAGFESRKQARAFANRLLELGLIKHAVNLNRFSEKCYYKFDGEREPLARRPDRALCRQNKRRAPKAARAAGEKQRFADRNHVYERPDVSACTSISAAAHRHHRRRRRRLLSSSSTPSDVNIRADRFERLPPVAATPRRFRAGARPHAAKSAADKRRRTRRSDANARSQAAAGPHGRNALVAEHRVARLADLQRQPQRRSHVHSRLRLADGERGRKVVYCKLSRPVKIGKRGGGWRLLTRFAAASSFSLHVSVLNRIVRDDA